MRLSQLDAKLLKLDNEEHGSYWTNATWAEAQGIEFLCPKCFAENGGPVGTHAIICWFRQRGVPDHISPGPGRWNPSGSSIEDITFVPPGAVSVLLTGGCGWHGYVKLGDAS